LAARITWIPTGRGAAALAVSHPRTETERECNRRVEITLVRGAPPPPPPPCGNLKVWINAFIPAVVSGYTFTVPAGPHAGKTAIPCR
jgi:hypothetical protein